MKILVSAFACNPYEGSEPGIGWALASCIAKCHDVFLLTDDHNRAGLQRARGEGMIPSNMSIRFLRKCRPYPKNRLIAHLHCWMCYSEFAATVLNAAEEWHREEGFDLCHQVTLAAWRVPSPLWQLPIPFVWGPIGGAGYIPMAFRSMLSPTARLFERARDLHSWLSLRSGSFRRCIRNSSVVIAANEETQKFLAIHRSTHPLVCLPSGTINADRIRRFSRTEPRRLSSAPLRLFAGGTVDGRKGFSLAIQALAKLSAQGVDFHYTIAGGGAEVRSLQALTAKLGLSSKVEFHPGYQGDDYVRALHASDVYLLPSFRETTPATLLEAYLAGCYPVVADTGAQGEIVRMAGGKLVWARNQSEMIEELAKAVLWCHENRNLLARAVAEARSRVIEYFSSERFGETLESVYQIATNATPTH